MPQLRSGVRIGRPSKQPIAAEKFEPEPVQEEPEKKKRGRKNTRKTGQVNRTVQNRRGRKKKAAEEPVVVGDSEEKNAVRTPLEEEEKGKKQGLVAVEIKDKEAEEIWEKKMDKGFPAEDEGNTAPLLERVQVGGSPSYKIERNLEKGDLDKYMLIAVSMHQFPMKELALEQWRLL